MKNKLSKGDKIFYKNIGYGYVSYEPDVVIDIIDNKLFTNCFSEHGMQWDEKGKYWFFDGGLGLKQIVVSNDDKEANKYWNQYNDKK
jgi:hypothetical protein